MRKVKLLGFVTMLVAFFALHNSSVRADEECVRKDGVCTASSQCCGSMICVTSDPQGSIGQCQERASD
jgi:hypothetical protein